MIEVAPRLFLHPGPPKDVDLLVLEQHGWAILSAARDPWFRELYLAKQREDPMFVLTNIPGVYLPQQLYLQEGNRLYLNLVDADSMKYFAPEVFDAALAFLSEQHSQAERNVLIHCNMGISRSPSIAMLYMAIIGLLPSKFEDAMSEFKKLYTIYNPAAIIDWIEAHWNDYV